jgi:hypothetical protein
LGPKMASAGGAWRAVARAGAGPRTWDSACGPRPMVPSGVRGVWPRPSTHARTTPAPGGHRSVPRGPTRAVSGGYDLDWDSTPSPGFRILHAPHSAHGSPRRQAAQSPQLPTQLFQRLLDIVPLDIAGDDFLASRAADRHTLPHPAHTGHRGCRDHCDACATPSAANRRQGAPPRRPKRVLALPATLRERQRAHSRDVRAA